ncbi:MAG: aminotransferase class V-fold PLP-dependent enzyme [Butyricicoccaceae bacterium]
MHYLDNAATTRVLPEAAEAAVHAMLEEFGNPSSLHRMGLEASHLLEDSRRTVASALGCLPEEVYFTACGTESTNISLRGAAHLNRHKRAASSRPRSSTRQPSTPQSSCADSGLTWFSSRRTRPATSRPRC